MAQFDNNRQRLFVPAVAPLYNATHDLVETILRVAAGLLLVTHGFGKIVNPFGAVGMVENLGFYPGVFWSPLLAATEFFGGILVAIGLFKRPASFAAMIVLLVTVYVHGILRAEGLVGAEKSILWAAIFLFFAVATGILSTQNCCGNSEVRRRGVSNIAPPPFMSLENPFFSW